MKKSDKLSDKDNAIVAAVLIGAVLLFAIGKAGYGGDIVSLGLGVTSMVFGVAFAVLGWLFSLTGLLCLIVFFLFLITVRLWLA